MRFATLISFFSLSLSIMLRQRVPKMQSTWATISNVNDLELRSSPSPHVKFEPDNSLILPSLSFQEKALLLSNKRVQNQKRVGRQGYGWVVVDLKANPERVFQTLTDFERYQNLIPTVRSAKILSVFQNTTSAEFLLSRFRLPVSVQQTVIQDQHLIRFNLDPYHQNPAISEVDGFWHVETPEERVGYARVWLYAHVVASRLLPNMIVDYAASRALPRATEWLQKYFPS